MYRYTSIAKSTHSGRWHETHLGSHMRAKGRSDFCSDASLSTHHACPGDDGREVGSDLLGVGRKLSSPRPEADRDPNRTYRAADQMTNSTERRGR